MAVKEHEPAGRECRSSDPTLRAIDDLPNTLIAILEPHRPSRMPFFRRLAGLPSPVVRDPLLLGQIHLIYQSAMHATRAAVYYLPHLDRPELRKRKLRIFVDDDGLAGGDTHHYQLTRAFRSIGARCLLEDEEFGEPAELCHYLAGETADFVRLARELYSRSLAAWCAVEMLSVDWMRALADGLSVHFPHFGSQPYFSECFSQAVEERHAADAVEVTQIVLRARPELLHETLRDARIIAEALDGVWTQLDRIVRDAQAAATSGAKAGRRSGTRDLASPAARPELEPGDDPVLKPLHFHKRLDRVGPLEIDVDRGQPEAAQRPQIGDDIRVTAGK
jgi:pyrroloquinoline quinone (PQQ) biosynthesis protein C